MSTMIWKTVVLAALGAGPLVFATNANTNTASAKDKKTQDKSAASVDRKAKSEMFDKMAQCLKSDKSEAQCEEELGERCQRMGGMSHCGMGMMMGKMGKHGNLGGGMMNHGMKHGGMSNDMDKGSSSQGDSSGDKGMEPME